MKKTILKLLSCASLILFIGLCSCTKTNSIGTNDSAKTTTDSETSPASAIMKPATATSIGQSAFSLWGSCSDMPYLISGTNGICVPSGNGGCGSDYLGAQQSSGQSATGMQFYGCFKGGSNAPDGSNEMAVFICTDVTNWVGHEMGFIKTLNDNTLKMYVQGNGNYNYKVVPSAYNDNGYHTFKCQVESADHSNVDFYIDGNYINTVSNSGVDYWNGFYYFVGTTHRTSDGWSSAGQQIEMYDMTIF